MTTQELCRDPVFSQRLQQVRTVEEAAALFRAAGAELPLVPGPGPDGTLTEAQLDSVLGGTTLQALLRNLAE